MARRSSDLVRFYDFTGGVHAEKSDAELKGNEFAEMTNFVLAVDGRAKKRKGLKRYNATSLGTGGILGAHRYQGSQSAAQLLVVHGTNIYLGDDAAGTFTSEYSTLTTGKQAFWHTWKDNAYMANGIDGPLYWDGATMHSVTTTITGMADARYLTHYADRLWFAVSPDTLYYSELLDPTLWKHTDAATGNTLDNLINVSVGDDNVITGLSATEMHLVIYKARAIYYLSGYASTEWVLNPVSTGLGCIAPRSICEIDGRIFWLSHRGIFTDNGRSFDRISTQVQPILDQCTTAQLATAAAEASGYTYRISLPDHPDGAHVLVYDLRLEEWTVFTSGIGLGGFVPFNLDGDTGDLVAWDADNGLVYYADTGGQDDATDITATLKTARINIDDPELELRLRRLMARVNLDAGDTAKLEWLINGSSTAGDTMTLKDGLASLSLGPLARDVAFKVTITGSGTTSELVGFTAELKPVRRRWAV